MGKPGGSGHRFGFPTMRSTVLSLYQCLREKATWNSIIVRDNRLSHSRKTSDPKSLFRDNEFALRMLSLSLSLLNHTEIMSDNMHLEIGTFNFFFFQQKVTIAFIY